MRINVFFLVVVSVCSAGPVAESFEQKMSRARYSDARTLERVEMYQDLLRSITRGFASESETHEFVTNVLGVLRQRPTSDVATLRVLSDLVKAILSSRVVVLQGYSKDFSHWKDVLEADLLRFALAHGDVVRMSLSHAPQECLTVVSGEDAPRVDLMGSDGLSAFFKLALRGSSGDAKTQQIVAGGGKIDVIPLYWERFGVACALGDDYTTQFQGDVLAKKPIISMQKNVEDKALPFHVMKREKVPAYIGEPLIVAHPGRGEWTTVMEKISLESLSKLENDNIQQALERIRAMSTPLDKIRWFYTLRFNFNSRVSEKNYSALFKQLSALMSLRSQFDLQTLLAARQVLEAYEFLHVFKDQTRYLIEWQRGINKLLEPHAIKYGDVIKIASSQREDGVLCVAPYVTGGSSGFSKEIRLGIGPVHGSGHGHSLISLISPVGKLGPIALGDEVELSLPHVDGNTELRCVSLPGEGSVGGRVLALNIADIEVTADTIFSVEGPLGKGLSGENRGAPLVGGDPFVLRSKKTQKLLGARRRVGAALWSMVELLDASEVHADGVVLRFCVDRMPVEAVANVVTRSFYDKLALIRQDTSVYGKVAKLMTLLDAFSPKVSIEDRDDFWDVIVNVMADKKRMNEYELERVIDLLNKIIVVGKANGIYQWLDRAKQALTDFMFYKKVRRAVAVPGMDRFKNLLELTPEIKGISLSESQDFVATLKSLRKYKKDQSRAAKLLLSQVEDESKSDFTVTGSGNLLIP